MFEEWLLCHHWELCVKVLRAAIALATTKLLKMEFRSVFLKWQTQRPPHRAFFWKGVYWKNEHNQKIKSKRPERYELSCKCSRNSPRISEILDLEENQYIKLSVYSDVPCAHHTFLNITDTLTWWTLPAKKILSKLCICVSLAECASFFKGWDTWISVLRIN